MNQPCVRCCAWSLSRVRLSATPWTAAHLAPLSTGILQARILECVAMSSSRGSSQPRDRTHSSRIAHRFFTIWAPREAQEYWSGQPVPSPVDLPDPGIELGPPALQADSLPAEPPGTPKSVLNIHMSPPSWASLPLPIPPLQVITEHQAELHVISMQQLPASYLFYTWWHACVSTALWIHPPSPSPAMSTSTSSMCLYSCPTERFISTITLYLSVLFSNLPLVICYKRFLSWGEKLLGWCVLRQIWKWSFLSREPVLSMGSSAAPRSPAWTGSCSVTLLSSGRCWS